MPFLTLATRTQHGIDAVEVEAEVSCKVWRSNLYLRHEGSVWVKCINTAKDAKVLLYRNIV